MATKINWYRTPIERDVLKGLTKKRNFPGLVQSFAFLIIYAGLAFWAVYFMLRRMWLPMAVTCYVHSMFSSFLGMEAAVHELSHKTPFKAKWLNEIFYYLFSFLTWNNPVHFRISHMRHHQLTVHEGLDKEVKIMPAPYRFGDWLSWFTFDVKKFKMIMFTNIAHFFGKGDVDFFHWDPLLPEGDPDRKRMIRWSRFLVIGHLVLLGVFIYFELWVLIYCVTFGYFFATFVGQGTGLIQHQGMRSSVPDWRLSCHTVITGPIIGFLYWRMNYHVEHHMYAAVPFYRLKKLHAAIKQDLPEPSQGFFAGLKKVRQAHRKQRTEPDYVYQPVFPDTAAPPKYS